MRPWRPHASLYRSLARKRPETFNQGLADTLGTYASILQWSGKEAEAARIRQEIKDVTLQMEIEASGGSF